MTLDTRLTDAHLLALTLYGEARSSALEEMIALACLIRNRVTHLDASWSNLCVSHACWDAEKQAGNHAKVQERITELLTGKVTDPLYLQAAWIATGILNGWCPDVIKGATAAHPSTEVPRPEWAQQKIPLLNYARHTFYAVSA